MVIGTKAANRTRGLLNGDMEQIKYSIRNWPASFILIDKIC